MNPRARRAGAVLLALLASLGSASAVSATALESVVRQVYLMGTRATLTTLADDRAAGLATLDSILATLERVEGELSTWRDDSALSAINRTPPGTALAPPDALCVLLAELQEWAARTDGAFDPAVGRLVRSWGLREGGRIPKPAELSRARADSGIEWLRIESDPCRVTRLRAVLLDAGAFGKGAAIDRVREAAEPGGDQAPWMIDLGGQVGVGGAPRPWTVALAHPVRRDELALELTLESGSLATSAGSERDLRVGNRRIGHVIDPRSGEPIERRASVTVWHPRALVADLLSTALYVMGPEHGLEWAQTRDLAVCFLLVPDRGPDDLQIRASESFRERFLGGISGEEPR